MAKFFRHPIPTLVDNVAHVGLPVGAKVFSVGMDDGCVWMSGICDDELAAIKVRRFVLVGEKFNEFETYAAAQLQYVGTASGEYGASVHVFEIIDREEGEELSDSLKTLREIDAEIRQLRATAKREPTFTPTSAKYPNSGIRYYSDGRLEVFGFGDTVLVTIDPDGTVTVHKPGIEQEAANRFWDAVASARKAAEHG